MILFLSPIKSFRYFPLFLIVLILGLSACSRAGGKTADQVCWGKNCVDVEIVSSAQEVARGLKFRESLREDAGMLFLLSENRRHSFWMKDTLIPLDIIWIDYSKRVVHIEENVPPCRSDPCKVYTPLEDALYVLEVNASMAKSTGLKIGTQLDFHIQDDL